MVGRSSSCSSRRRARHEHRRGRNREHYGLVGIRERADAVGAHVTLDSTPERGTTVLVELEVPR